jgi:hypothetical protein
MNQLARNPQLVIKRYSQNGTAFAHCLVCSTAPKNAESRYREDLSTDYSDSLQSLNQLKSALKAFVQSQWQESGKNILKKISIVIDIHGFNTPLKVFEKDTYDLLEQKFQADSSGQIFDDFVIFINFSWPSEAVFTSQWLDWARAMPLLLQILLIGAILLVALSWPSLLYSLGLILGSLVFCLVAQRWIVYFRDRDRAANFGVFDAVELVRWLHVILQEILHEQATPSAETTDYLRRNPIFFGTVNLSFIAHSMGCFVTTQMIRILSDVFDSSAIQRWRNHSSDGPFGGSETEFPPSAEEMAELKRIGNFFTLKSLVLASPDIPIWAMTTGRSNFLRACLRRFEAAYLFTNNADMVLRLASTLANYFIFPSASRLGGYRLGNLTIIRHRTYGVNSFDTTELGIRAFIGGIGLADKPFYSQNDIYRAFRIVDCTDYKDKLATTIKGATQRRLSVLTANTPITNLLNYILTPVWQLLKIGQMDSHGGYFRGQFCLSLLYALALYDQKTAQQKLCGAPENWDRQLKLYQIAWVQTTDGQEYAER